jgi:hypothetical protein
MIVGREKKIQSLYVCGNTAQPDPGQLKQEKEVNDRAIQGPNRIKWHSGESEAVGISPMAALQ